MDNKNINLKVINFLKEAGVFQGAATMGARAGKGLWNIAFGGKTVGSKWHPWAGVTDIGKVKSVYGPESGALAGMRKLDPATGEPIMEKGRNVLNYFKQEYQGSAPKRSDVFAKREAGKLKINPGEYLKQVEGSPALQNKFNEINQMGSLEFMKKHPGTAFKYYGGHTLNKGLMVGIPGMEDYHLMKDKEGPHPNEGMGSNIGSIAASGLGWLGTMPLGLVGAPLAVGALAGAGRRVGRRVDKVMGNNPIGGKSPYPFPNPSQAAQIPYDYPMGQYPPQIPNH